MIRQLIKSFITIVFIYFSFMLMYLSYVQAGKLKSYENKNEKWKEEIVLTKYSDPSITIEDKGNNDLNNFIKCYQNSGKTEEFSQELKSKINAIHKHFASSGPMVSFSYEDLYTGLHLSFNENSQYFTASTIKSPVALYIYDLNIHGKINFNEYLTYQASQYIEGSGTIQYQPIGTSYTIKELLEKSIVISDNIAYQMLADRVYSNEIKNYWKNLGATTFWTNGSTWGSSTTKDNAIYMKQLYNITQKYPKETKDLLNYHFNSVANFIKLNNKDIPIAHKSGWNAANVHDMAIIYNKQPYVLAINTLRGYDGYENFYYQATKLINDFHESYWSEKASMCYNQTFN